jgi:FG-GAP repeat
MRHRLAAMLRTLPPAFAALALVAGGARAQVPAVGLSTVHAQSFGNENLLGFYTPQAEDFFAMSLATGDFNGDGADDLATGVPFDDGLADSPIVDSGSVIVRYGISGAGLATSLAGTVLRQTPAVNPAEEGDNFGYALASCDFNGDGFDDLAVGIRVRTTWIG